MSQSPIRICYPTNEEYHVLGIVDCTTHRESIIAKAITDNEIDKLQNEETIVVKHDGNANRIDATDCYLYGPVNLNPNDSDNDLDILTKFMSKWTNAVGHGNFIPRKYDYETNSGETIVDERNGHNRFCTVETFSPVLMFKYAHACLGYPKNVVVYKVILPKRK